MALLPFAACACFGLVLLLIAAVCSVVFVFFAAVEITLRFKLHAAGVAARIETVGHFGNQPCLGINFRLETGHFDRGFRRNVGAADGQRDFKFCRAAL